MVAELQEEVERLRSIRKAGKETGGAMLCPPEAGTGTAAATSKNPRSRGSCIPPNRTEGSSSKEESEWRQVHARGGKRTPSLPTWPSQVPLYNRYEALEVEGQSMEDVDDGPSIAEVLPR